MNHFLVKCRECEKIMNQCRCMDPKKKVEWSLCEKCAKEERKKIMGAKMPGFINRLRGLE